jgi:hypothetical protein
VGPVTTTAASSSTIIPATPEPVPASSARPAATLLPLELMPFRANSAEERGRLLGQGLARELIADVLVPIDAPDSRLIRASAVRLLLEPGLTRDHGWVIGFGSAAWLHTGSSGLHTAPVPSPGGQLQIIITPGDRRPGLPWIRARQVALAPEHVMFLEGVRVTHPVRTAADVARDLPEAQALPVLRRLGELTPARPHQVLALLETMKYARGAAIARRVVRSWAEAP